MIMYLQHGCVNIAHKKTNKQTKNYYSIFVLKETHGQVQSNEYQVKPPTKKNELNIPKFRYKMYNHTIIFHTVSSLTNIRIIHTMFFF